MFAQISRLLIVALTMVVLVTAAPVALLNNDVVVTMDKRAFAQEAGIAHYAIKSRSIFNGDYSGEHPRDGLRHGKKAETRDVVESDEDLEDRVPRHSTRPGGGLEAEVGVEKRNLRYTHGEDETEDYPNWHGIGRILSPWDNDEAEVSHAPNSEKRDDISKRWVNPAKGQGWSSDNGNHLGGVPAKNQNGRHKKAE